MTPNSEQAWRRATMKAAQPSQQGYAAGSDAALEEFKRMTVRERRVALAAAKREIKVLDRSAADNRKSLARLYVFSDAYPQVKSWAAKPIRMERPEHSIFHNLRADAIADRLLCLRDTKKHESGPVWDEELLKDANVFLVQHDWASAFKSAEDFEAGPFRLPFDICAFEFRISGAPVFALATQIDELIYLCPIIGCEDGWSYLNHFKYREHGEWEADGETVAELRDLAKFLGKQIKAISVTLDAEVAEAEIIRAPHKLNAARERRGEIPMYSYHVVALGRRFRAAAAPSSEMGTTIQKRLHFRRGHWRHFETFKSWVRWCLVGNPDLGFVDKHYKL